MTIGDFIIELLKLPLDKQAVLAIYIPSIDEEIKVAVQSLMEREESVLLGGILK